jgi:phenylalanyl-tRNA synthetase beta chain
MYGAQIATEKLEKFDCSLLTQHIYAKAGVILGRTAEQQYSSGMEVPDFGLKPGDLLFLYGDETKNGQKIGHVGILTSDNKVLQASSTQKQVVLSPITKFTKAKNYAGARRYVENFNHIISVEVPWWRNDVSLEVDLYEEVAKSIGYTRMPETLPQLPPSDTTKHQLLPYFMKLRTQLAALGLDEVMTYSFVSKRDVENINAKLADHLQIENPLSSEQDYLRTTMLSSHLQVAANNPGEGTIFEISRVYRKHKLGAKETWKLAITVWGENSLLRVMGVCDNIWGWYKYKPAVSRLINKNYIVGRSAEISDELGVFGQLSPVITNNFGIKGEVAFAEIDLDKITQLQGRVQAHVIPPYQLIRRDITVELPVEILWQVIVESIGSNAKKLEFGGEFSNEELQGRGRKRVSMIVYFDLGPNPTSAEIQKSMDKCYKALLNIKTAKVL